MHNNKSQIPIQTFNLKSLIFPAKFQMKSRIRTRAFNTFILYYQLVIIVDIKVGQALNFHNVIMSIMKSFKSDKV